MSYQMYLQMGVLNCLLVLVVLWKTMSERAQFRDCRLFSYLLIALLLVDITDTVGWILDGKLTGGLSLITSLADAINLAVTAFVCWCWVQYVQFLAYEDAGIPAQRDYFSTSLFFLQFVLVLVAIPTKFIYYIDAEGYYVRGTGYGFFTAVCLVQLVYSVGLCFWTCHKVEDVQKRRELQMVGLIVFLPMIGAIFQGLFYGTPVIWTSMTVFVILVYIHIQDKRRSRENAEQQDQLRAALQQAQYASKAKTEFLSNMSHDIRTPMNAIIGFTAIAAGHIDDREIVQDSLSKITTSSKHLLNLINDVLDMSRIESGKMQLQVVPCNLAKVMHDLVDMIQSQVSVSQLELFVDTLHVRNEEILADPIKINQIFLNLIGNAIKFNKPGGRVSIRVEQKESATEEMGSYVFTVKDTGTGIAPEYLNQIFEPFERGVQEAAKDRVEGTGLGLAIVKNIVDMMGGTISVTSELGKGSEFRVGLSFGLQTEPETAGHCEKMQGMRALVVDDDYDTCDSVTGMLHEIGLAAEWTLTGKEAVFKAKKAAEIHKAFDAFFLDWLIPDMNGIEVTRRIRSVVGRETPIFILTAYDWTDMEQEAKEAGVTAFCRKPLFMSELRGLLEDASGLAHDEPKEEKPKYNAEDFRGKRILLVEDHPLNREIAVRLLSDKGFRVEEAEDGLVALEKFKLSRNRYYDLILMDIRMPRMDGYQASDHIRALEREDAKTVPIIAMTANAFEEDKLLALEHGMNEHLAKPLNVENLFGTLAKYLHRN